MVLIFELQKINSQISTVNTDLEIEERDSSFSYFDFSLLP